eukprot:TRINITY_DN3597_c0_g1_i1.p1 TRINITY_DN3597_c0_g1~~TRINITY_DN3597_c0_g1_i1.p1  ORF type:complete len:587 (-),score=137.33 TRINITY_DN3597_c0_g1_i1:875-2635(-)
MNLTEITRAVGTIFQDLNQDELNSDHANDLLLVYRGLIEQSQSYSESVQELVLDIKSDIILIATKVKAGEKDELRGVVAACVGKLRDMRDGLDEMDSEESGESSAEADKVDDWSIDDVLPLLMELRAVNKIFHRGRADDTTCESVLNLYKDIDKFGGVDTTGLKNLIIELVHKYKNGDSDIKVTSRSVHNNISQARKAFQKMYDKKNRRDQMRDELDDQIQEGDPYDYYEIKKILGQGEFGKVYKASDKESGDDVAIKNIAIHSDQDLRLTLTEIKAMRTVSIEANCENCLGYYKTFKKDGDLWVVMELCSRGSIEDIVIKRANEDRRPCLPESTIASIAKQVANGLSFLHEKRIIHRDIKCGNILLTSDGVAKLCDLGVAGIGTARTTTVGSAYWMAPEIMNGGGVYDERVDVWSFGITLIEMAEGFPPKFHEQNPTMAMVTIPQDPSPSLKDPSKWSPEFVNLIEACVQKSAERRPPCKIILEHPMLAASDPKNILSLWKYKIKIYHNNSSMKMNISDTTSVKRIIRAAVKKFGKPSGKSGLYFFTQGEPRKLTKNDIPYNLIVEYERLKAKKRDNYKFVFLEE